jgi:hypothetical protein
MDSGLFMGRVFGEIVILCAPNPGKKNNVILIKDPQRLLLLQYSHTFTSKKEGDGPRPLVPKEGVGICRCVIDEQYCFRGIGSCID